MPTLQPPSASPPDTTDDDPRLGHLLDGDPDTPDALSVVLIGFPVDEGVVRNGGRAGAAEGPPQLRKWLYGMTPDARRYDAFLDLLRATADAGDVVGDEPLKTRQAHLGETLAPYLGHDVFSIVLGGGHETAYGHFRGYVEAELEISILNWDAHVDVRPLTDGRPHSGSSFRQALDHPSGLCQRYTVAGLQPHGTAADHLRFVEKHDGRFLWADEVSRATVEALYEETAAPTMVTFDLDAVDQAQAPGVSAPAVGGLDQDLWLHAAYHAGRCPNVTSVDVSELNPTVDADNRTARLAALTVMQVLRGLTDRRTDS